MPFFRLLIVLAVTGLVVFLLLYLFTRNQRYLAIAWQIVVVGVVALLIVGAVVIVERFVLI